MEKVVKTQRTQPGSSHLAGWRDEHQVVVGGEELGQAQIAELECDLGHEWHRTDAVGLGEVLVAFVGEASLHMEQRAWEIDRAPPEGLQLAGAQAG